MVLMSPEGPSRRNRRGWSASHLGSAAAVQPGSSVSRRRPSDRPSPGRDPGRRDRQAGTADCEPLLEPAIDQPAGPREDAG